MRALKVLTILVVTIGFLVWGAALLRKELVAKRSIVNEVKGLIDSCRLAGDNAAIASVGKVLVWDMRDDSPDYTYHLLPDSTQANSTDSPITVFMILGGRVEKLESHSISGALEYLHSDVAVALWPEKKPVGFYSVITPWASGSSSFYHLAKWINTLPQRRIVNEVKVLIDSCRASNGNIAVVGKALVWDMRGDSLSGAYDMLPESIRANSRDSTITIFMVISDRNETVGTYSISRAPAYRVHIDIAVASWPDKKPVGFYSIVGMEPPLSRTVQLSPGYGETSQAVAKWIKVLRHVP